MKKLVSQSAAIYLLLLCALYYIAPLPSIYDRAVSGDYLMYLLFIFNPIGCFAANFLYCAKHPFSWLLPLLCGAAFTPAVYIFYNHTALVYVFSYIVLSFIGAAAGYSSLKGRNSKD